MKMIRMTVAIAAVGLGLALGATAAKASELSADEVVSLHAGQCITYWGVSEGTQCFTADGRTNYNDTTYGTDTGRWEMRGNEMCVNWDSEPGGFECGAIWRVDAQTFTDGDYSWRIN